MNILGSEDTARDSGSWTPVALGLGVLALGVALAHGFGLGIPGLSTAGALLLFGGAALSLLTRVTPAEPSPWKLLTLGVLLSPFLVAAPYLLLRTFVDVPLALAGAFGCVALAQLPGLGCRVAFHRTGRGTLAALLGVLALTIFVAWVHGGGNALRLGDGGVERAALALAVDRAVPPDNPFLAGEAWARPWADAGLVAAVGRILDLAPSRAEAWLAVWATLGLGLSLVLSVAALWRSGPSTASSPWALAVGVGVPAALSGILAFGSTPGAGVGSTLAEGLLGALGGIPEVPQTPLAVLLRTGPDGMALALLGGAFLCATHGLRHGIRPWPALTGILLGLAELIRPGCAWVPSASIALAALLAPGLALARPRMLLSVAVGFGAPLLLERGAGWSESIAGAFRLGVPELPGSVWAGVALALAPVVLRALLTLGARGRGVRGAGEAAGPGSAGRSELSQGFLGVHLMTLMLMGLGLGARLGPVPGLELPDVGGGLRTLDGGLVGFCGTVGLAGWGALGGFWPTQLAPSSRWGALARLLVRGLAIAWVLVGIAGLERHRDLWVRSGWRRAEWPLLEDPMGYGVAEGEKESEEARDLREALAFLRHGLDLGGRPPVLILNPEPPNPGASRSAAGFHLGGLCTGLDLWSTEGEGLAPGEVRATRLRGLLRLYREKGETDITSIRELQRMGRPAVALVTRDDRSDRPWLENKFGPLGFRMLRLFGSVSVYVWPGELAETVDPELRPFPADHFPRGIEPVLGREEKR